MILLWELHDLTSFQDEEKLLNEVSKYSKQTMPTADDKRMTNKTGTTGQTHTQEERPAVKGD